MKKYILVAIKPHVDGGTDKIERVYSGSEQECMLYRDIVEKEMINEFRHKYAGWELHIV